MCLRGRRAVTDNRARCSEGASTTVDRPSDRGVALLGTWENGASRHDCGSFWGCDRAAFASAGPACRAAVTHPARRLAVRAGPRRCFPVVGEGSSGGLDREWAGCRQRRDQDGSAPKALRLVIAALAGLLGGREERVQIAARPVQPKTVALQGETNGQTARSPTFMPEDPSL